MLPNFVSHCRAIPPGKKGKIRESRKRFYRIHEKSNFWDFLARWYVYSMQFLPELMVAGSNLRQDNFDLFEMQLPR